MKKNIMLVIITAVICISGAVFAVTQIESKDITYDNTNSGLTSTDVQGAINELYEMGSSKDETVLWTNPSPTATFSAQTVTLSESYENYSYLGFEGAQTKSNTTVTVTTYISVEDFEKCITRNVGQDIGFVAFSSRNNYVQESRRASVVTDSTTQISIGSACRMDSSNAGCNDEYAIPIKIVGIK